jgi:hypothetical protein
VKTDTPTSGVALERVPGAPRRYSRPHAFCQPPLPGEARSAYRQAMSKSAQWREKAAECRRVAGLVPPGGAPIFAALIDLALELDKMAEDAEERERHRR